MSRGWHFLVGSLADPTRCGRWSLEESTSIDWYDNATAYDNETATFCRVGCYEDWSGKQKTWHTFWLLLIKEPFLKMQEKIRVVVSSYLKQGNAWACPALQCVAFPCTYRCYMHEALSPEIPLVTATCRVIIPMLTLISWNPAHGPSVNYSQFLVQGHYLLNYLLHRIVNLCISNGC